MATSTESQICLCYAYAYLLPVLFIVRCYCQPVFAAGWLAFPLAIISTLLVSRISMLCNTHVLYGLRVHVLHSLCEARMIRFNCISIAVAIGAAGAAMAAPVFCHEENECAGFKVMQYALSWAEPNDTPN